jgi:hypothetical protein
MPTVLRRESAPNSPMQNSAPATISTQESGTESTIEVMFILSESFER